MGQSQVSTGMIILAFVAVVAIVASTVAGWVIVGNLGDSGDNDTNTEVLAAGLAVGRHASALNSVSSVASNFTMTRESVLASRTSIANHKEELTRQLANLDGKGFDHNVARIRQQVDLLTSQVDRIEQARPNLLRAMLAGEQSRQRIVQSTSKQLIPSIVDSIDGQFYYMATGRSDVRADTDDPAVRLSDEEFLRYVRISNLLTAVSGGQYSLLIASRMLDPMLVTNLEEGFGTASQRAVKSLEFLAANGGPEMHPAVVPLTQQLIDAGAGQNNFFDALKSRLSMAVAEQDLIEANQQVLDQLNAEIDALVEEVMQESESSSDNVASSASTGRTTIIIIGVAGLVVILLIAGFFGLARRQP